MDISDYDSQTYQRLSRDQYLTGEEAMELIKMVKKDTYCRLYLPSGKIFLNIIDDQWVLAFFGEYTNMPQKEMKPGVTWKPAQGTYRLNFEEVFKLASYLWDYLSGYLEINQKMMGAKSPKNITSNKVIMGQYSPERNQVFIRYIDYKKNQSTIFPVSQHHALELYLGLLSGFRSIAERHFKEQQYLSSKEGVSPTPIQILEVCHVNNTPLEIILREKKMIIRDVRSQDKIEAIHIAHATMFAHMFTSYLCRKMDRIVKFGERVTVTLPHIQTLKDDDGALNIGNYKSDFSKENTRFNVALHMGSYCLIDGMPTSLIR